MSHSISEHFNQLTPAEAERLAMLAEEAGEIVQAVGKILRHGFGSYHSNHPSLTNRMLLSKEIADLFGVVQMMEPDFDPAATGGTIEEVVRRKLRYSHHQAEICAGEMM